MPNNIDIAKQWFNKAKNDLLNTDNNLKSEIIPFDTVCFHCQQAVEKLFKAYLAGNDQQYPYSHDLLLLLESILPLDGAAENLRDSCAILMPYAVEIRYPDDWFMPSMEDAKDARKAADEVLHWFKNSLQELF